MNSKDYQILGKIYAETSVIRNLIVDTNFETFCADEKTKRAVCMTLINIGELVKSLSEDIRAANAQIPWRAIAGLRDVTVHRYQAIIMEDIWQTVNADIPYLSAQIAKVLNNRD